MPFPLVPPWGCFLNVSITHYCPRIEWQPTFILVQSLGFILSSALAFEYLPSKFRRKHYLEVFSLNVSRACPVWSCGHPVVPTLHATTTRGRHRVKKSTSPAEPGKAWFYFRHANMLPNSEFKIFFCFFKRTKHSFWNVIWKNKNQSSILLKQARHGERCFDMIFKIHSLQSHHQIQETQTHFYCYNTTLISFRNMAPS